MVTAKVREWFAEDDGDGFLDEQLDVDEVQKAILRLNKGEAAGCDAVTAEHLQYAGPAIFPLMTKILNRLIDIEYTPKNFKMGTQIPLYKGKNTCALDQNN